MERRKELSTDQRAQITVLRGLGLSYNQIAGFIGCSKTTVYNTVRNFQQRSHHASAARSGRPPKWTARHRRYLTRETLKNPFLSWRQLSAVLGGIPLQVLRRTAYRAGINRRIALKKPFLTARNKVKRLNWALANQSTNWKLILFTDESTVELGERPGRTWVSRRPGTRNHQEHMVPTFRSGRFSVHVWAGIGYNLKTRLFVIPLAPRTKRPNENKWDPAETLTAKKYCNFVVDGPLKETVEQAALAGIELEVVEDGSRIHWANITKERRNRYGIRSHDHPPSSPDLNPIENMWALMKNWLSKRSPLPRTREELAEAVEQAWNNIPMDYVNACVESMEERVRHLLTKRGGPLKY
ncbi:uncharacterized protein UTRI_10036 [Ustilago trichophora]|uniref:Tc1-like transposase DDE domain-containing protein n=1 Tax=Ustilago trichophora TaxID=86804 RepID=A0A5C3DS76_9BASI|nr:uncharacterized protein UTRI_10036 [Ustilago trichophora]